MNLSFQLTCSINHSFILPFNNYFSSSLLSPHLLSYVQTRYENDGFNTNFYGLEVSCDQGIICSVRGFTALKNGQYTFDNYYYPAVVSESCLFADLQPLDKEKIASSTISNLKLLQCNNLSLCSDYNVDSILLDELSARLSLSSSTHH